jgi:excisionase family DNA binding protein
VLNGALALFDVDATESLAARALADQLRSMGASLREHEREDALAFLVATVWEASLKYDRERCSSFETAERLRVSRQSVYRAISSGRLPAVQLGGPGTPLRVDELELHAWLYGTPGGPLLLSPAPDRPAERDNPRGEVDSPQPAGQEESHA